jgi:hypothetical protein
MYSLDYDRLAVLDYLKDALKRMHELAEGHPARAARQ